jgi:uncharacterized surface protein with fasciclin (FAS1) repeats
MTLAFAPATPARASLAASDARAPLCAARAPRAAAATLRMAAYAPTGSGYGGSGIPYVGFQATGTSDIVETAAAVPVFKTLVGLLRETGLAYELQKGGEGFTLFAPTDAAFAGLLEPHSFKSLAPLLRPENRAELRKVLAHHVVKGRISSGAIAASGTITVHSLAGVPISIMLYGKKMSAGSAKVVNADIPCTNGVIHIVSSVLIPPSFTPQPAGPVKRKFFSSTVLDIYANTPTPRQALGLDPMPAGAGPGALAMFE